MKGEELREFSELCLSVRKRRRGKEKAEDGKGIKKIKGLEKGGIKGRKIDK